ncbi:hypothetical protein SHIRM173S_13052 [Streptomyces hirsutus]
MSPAGRTSGTDPAPAPLPAPPYYAVVFTAVRTAGDDGYGETAEQLLEPAAEVRPTRDRITAPPTTVGIAATRKKVSSSSAPAGSSPIVLPPCSMNTTTPTGSDRFRSAARGADDAQHPGHDLMSATSTPLFPFV